MSVHQSKVFISYSRTDGKFALKLGKDLRLAGANIWLDQLDIVSGERWDDAIEGALKSCSSFLVILSPVSVESDNVKDELSFALEEKKQVVPVLYQSCQIPLRLRRIQHSDFTSDYNVGFEQLLNALNISQLKIISEKTESKADNIGSFKKPTEELQDRSELKGNGHKIEPNKTNAKSDGKQPEVTDISLSHKKNIQSHCCPVKE